ncbi:helix-turn-helix domain-containing protein [Clostridium beijerinckii]|uniref:helix-turn-helix domain-containing protein n=1 Tax=Clostridium beijerinckii TaxID=1520 RepID=UPI001F26DD31|nr:helix-turn-helix transcriptional regulator [Clostridium beijerinckii]
MRIDLKDEFKDLPANTIAENLIRLRKLNNLTQKELSLIIGISKSSISKYECGELFPTKEQSIKLANYFNINNKYFYDPYLESVDNFHKYLSTVLNKNIHINKDKLCKSLGISKRTLYRYCYENNVPTRSVFEKMQNYLNT